MSRRFKNLQFIPSTVRGHVQLTFVKPTSNGNYFSITSPPFDQSEPESISYALNHFLLQLDQLVRSDKLEQTSKELLPGLKETMKGDSPAKVFEKLIGSSTSDH